MTYTEFLANEQATLAFAKRCATLFHAPANIYLQGDLGAGKTTFVRGLLAAWGHQGSVKSPTYALVETYDLPEKIIHHFDLYRFSSPEEWFDAGLDELFEQNSLRLIEWAEQGGDYVPAADWYVHLVAQNGGREIRLLAFNQQAKQELTAWQN